MEIALPSPLLDRVPGEVKVKGKQNKVERIKPNKEFGMELGKVDRGRKRKARNKQKTASREAKK